MSNTPAESVPAPQPQVDNAAPGTAASETGRQPKKFDNVHKSVASKAKAFLNVFHSAGESIRGNINAALDGAGDAIASRKTGDVAGRKSAEQPSRRSMEPSTSEAAPAVADSSAPAPSPAAPAQAEAPAPVQASTSTEAAPETNAVSEAPAEGSAEPEKRAPVGQLLSSRFKRTVTLVTRVGSTLRSKGTRTVESLGNTLVEGKQRASRRFSRVPKAAPSEADDGAAPTVPAPSLPEPVPNPQPA